MENAEVAELRQLSQRVCASVAAYVGAQLSGSFESMQLLQQVVLNVDRKHAKMKQEVQSVGKLSKHLKAKAVAIDDKLKTIDDIDEELTELEDMVEQLEQYTGSLLPVNKLIALPYHKQQFPPVQQTLQLGSQSEVAARPPLLSRKGTPT